MASTSYTFPVATHSYFRVTNQPSEKKAFLKDTSYVPVFSYGKLMREALVKERLLKVSADSKSHTSLQTVLAGIELQIHATPETVEKFRKLNRELYDEPTKENILDILARVQEKVTPNTQDLWTYIQSTLSVERDELPNMMPGEDVFLYYKLFFDRYTNGSLLDTSRSLDQTIQALLNKTGLTKKGWRLVRRNDASAACVHHYNKTVSIGQQYVPRTPEGALCIAAHEVYGHALRGPQNSIAESEGFAILLEQLLDDTLKFKRSYRYLAAGLGWGSLGKPMNFREVYEIIWRVMVISGRYKTEQAKEHAFDEVARVFRGGNPGVPGAVYLKDAIYFEANVGMWRKLSDTLLEYNEFVDIIEGRRKILV